MYSKRYSNAVSFQIILTALFWNSSSSSADILSKEKNTTEYNSGFIVSNTESAVRMITNELLTSQRYDVETTIVAGLKNNASSAEVFEENSKDDNTTSLSESVNSEKSAADGHDSTSTTNDDFLTVITNRSKSTLTPASVTGDFDYSELDENDKSSDITNQYENEDNYADSDSLNPYTISKYPPTSSTPVTEPERFDEWTLSSVNSDISTPVASSSTMPPPPSSSKGGGSTKQLHKPSSILIGNKGSLRSRCSIFIYVSTFLISCYCL